MSRSQAAVCVSYHSQNADNWLRILVLCYCEQPTISCAYEGWTFEVAAQNICSRVTHMQSRTELLKACGGGETVTVRSVISSWRNWSQRLKLQYHVVCQIHGSGNVAHRNTCVCACLSECFAIRAREAVCYVRTYLHITRTNCGHTYILACIHIWIPTYVSTYIHTHVYTYIHTNRQTDRQTHTHKHNKGLFKKRTYFHPRQENKSNNWPRLLSDANSRKK